MTTWLNEYEVEEAARLFADHPVLGPATKTLANLVEYVNRNSDGWPYWAPPSRAASKLQYIIEQERRFHRLGLSQTATAEQIRKAYAPIKSFLTRHSFNWDVVVPV